MYKCDYKRQTTKLQNKIVFKPLPFWNKKKTYLITKHEDYPAVITIGSESR